MPTSPPANRSRLSADPPAFELRIAIAAARRGMSYPYQVWNFGDSVYFDALLALSLATGSAEFRSFAYGVAKAWASRPSEGFGDHVAPGAALVDLFRQTGDESLLGAAVNLAGLWERFPRCATAEAYLHTPERHRNVSIDCAHFDGPFFAKLAATTGEERYAERAVYELGWRLRLLQDTATGLCHHSFDSGRGLRNPALWGRGQGWALLGLVDTLSALPSDVDGRDELVERLHMLIDAMIAVQDAGGHWHTIVTEEKSYLEASVAAFFAAAVPVAVSAKLIESTPRVSDAVARAWRAVQQELDPSGKLGGVSAETMSTLSLEGYRRVPTGGLYPWGQGPLILAAIACQSKLNH